MKKIKLKINNIKDFYKYFLLDWITLLIFIYLVLYMIINKNYFALIGIIPVGAVGFFLDFSMRKYTENMKKYEKFINFYMIVITTEVLSIKNYELLWIPLLTHIIYLIIGLNLIKKNQKDILYDKLKK